MKKTEREEGGGDRSSVSEREQGGHTETFCDQSSNTAAETKKATQGKGRKEDGVNR